MAPDQLKATPLLPRLLKYAVAPQKTPTENFTTEALAAAIERDPEPFLAWVGTPLGSHVTSVETQVGLAGAGILDLLVACGSHDRCIEYWLEIKVDAALTGDQMERYTKEAVSRKDPQPEVLLVGPHRFGSVPKNQYLSWQSLWEILAQRTSGNLDLWLEFRSLLESIGMADQFGEPPTQDEVAAFASTYPLYRKMGRLLFNALAQARAEGLALEGDYSESSILQSMRTQFDQRTRWMVKLPIRKTLSVLVGAWPPSDGHSSPKCDKPRIGVWVEAIPKDHALRAEAFEALEPLNAKPSEWKAGLHSWVLLCRSVELSGLMNGDLSTDLADWLGELNGTGVFTLPTQDSGSSPATRTATSP